MRRPWIKIEVCTPDKPEVCSLATQLKMDDDAVMGKLVRLWSWAELNRIQPNDIGVTKEFIDKLVGRKGFAVALAQTGWLIETDGKLSFRNFKRHNSPVAQNKALTAKRVARHRLRKEAAQEKITPVPLDDINAETPIAEAPPVAAKVKKPKPAIREKVTIEPLPAPVAASVAAPVAEEVVVSAAVSEVTEPAIVAAAEVVESASEVSETASISDFGDDFNDVIKSDIPLISNEEEVGIDAEHVIEPVAPAVEVPAIEKQPETVTSLAVETPAQLTPEEALAALQLEEPAPRKRRAKAAADNDQPMLF